MSKTKNSKMEVNGAVKNPHIKNTKKSESTNIVLWKSPFTTLYYFIFECFYRFTELRFTIARHKYHCLFFISFFFTLMILNYTDGPHSNQFKKTSLWWLWWIWLGFLSSCGFGTGLHTFVLYLGPFIAEVTMSAYECGSLNFPQPPYPDRIMCPETSGSSEKITFWNIMRKVQIESVMWGFGTAIGELPPYFMAQGARLSGKYGDDDDELSDFEEVIASNISESNRSSSFQKKIELFLHRLIMRAGFLGILLCASIPNPLFDLAGMTCGHFLVPFWSFFGATFIGKAIVKVHIQQFTVIALSSEHHVETLVELLGRIPVYGKRLQAPFLEYLQQQKFKLHNTGSSGQQSWLQTVIFFVVTSLIVSFIISIINAFAKHYHRRLCKWQSMADRKMNHKEE